MGFVYFNISLIMVIYLWYNLSSSAGLAVMQPFMAEQYPTRVRATGYAVGMACGRFGTIVMMPILGWVMTVASGAIIGYKLDTALIGAMLIILVVLIAIFGKETARRKLEEISK